MKKLSLAMLQALTAGMTLSLLAAPVAAQETQKIEKIEVTGSNIRRTDAEGVAPIQKITAKDIERSGLSTVADVLRNITASTGNSFNETFTNSFSPGAAGVSLRGLSQKNTLVLLNSKRVANYGFAQNLQDTYVDLNAIPATAIERIEILKDGASAVYGSDAIAGVVNIILRRDYQGAEVGASYGTSYKHDLDEKKFNVIGGIGDLGNDKYNVLATFDYLKRNLLKYTDRDYTKTEDFRGQPGGLLQWSTNGGTYRLTGPTRRQPFANCPANQIRPLSDFNSTAAGTVCSYNPAPFLTLFPETERYQGVVSGTYQFSPDLSAFAEGLYSHNKTFQVFTPAALTNTSVAFDPTTGGVTPVANSLPVGNPNRVPGVGGTQRVNYTFFDVGGRDAEIKSDFYRLLGGFRGTVKEWDWEASALYSESKQDQNNFNRVDRFVLDRVRLNGSYSFINPASTPAVTDALRINPKRESTSKLESVGLKTSTDLVQMTSGPLGFAAGLEYRHESIDDRPDALLRIGNVLGQGSTATNGSRNDAAAFVEFNIPVIKTFEVNLQTRFDHYSDFGSATSPKGGFKWQPIKELLIRGSASRGFRAPTLPEIAKSSATFFVTIADPNNPTSPGALTNSAGVFAGNPQLKAERSNNFNFGLVFSPNVDLNFGVDYYKIEQKDVITSNGFQFIVNNPSLFPGQILRDANGNLVAVFDQYRNLSVLKTSGIDLDVNKIFRTEAAGKFTLNGTFTHLRDYRTPPAVDQPLADYAGNNGNGNGGLPKWRAVTSLTWEYAAWSSTLTHRYIHSFRQDLVTDAGNPGFQNYVGAYRQYDLYVAYEGIKNLKLFGSIQNLTNERPPFDPSGNSLPFDFSLYDARGRYFTVGAKYAFK